MGLILNESYKFGFVHIPKTGGTSITHLLSSIDGSKELTSHHGLSLLPDDSSFYYFTIVRNPFTRFASAYNHECRKYGFKEFDKFIKEDKRNYTWYVPQSFFTNSGLTNKRKFTKIIKYENYEQEIKSVIKELKIDLSNTPIPHLNRNPIYDKHPKLKQEKYYKHLYSETWMKDWIRERYKDDFKIFNYGMDI